MSKDISYKIIVVGEDESYTDTISELSEEYSHQYVFDNLSDPEEVPELLDEYDGLVSEYDIPGTDGLELLEEVREENPDIPFILYTDKGSEEVASDAISAGVTDYVQKSNQESLELVVDNLEEALEFRKREEQVERYDRTSKEVVDILAHDISNYLQIACGRAQMLEEESDTDISVTEYLERINEVVNDTKDMLKHGTLVDETEEFYLDDVAKETWERMEFESGELGVYADIEIEADQTRLESMLENLYKNSIEHGGDNVKVQVGPIQTVPTTTRSQDGDIEGFFVQDDGPGIPEEDREKVLETDFTTGKGSSGLGMSIVDQIADAHGWEMRIKESSLGGAKFEFII